MEPEFPQQPLSISDIKSIDIAPSVTQMDKRQQQALNFQFLGKGKMRFTWGNRPEDSCDFGYDNPLYKYINKHHDTAAIVAVNNSTRESTLQLLEKMKNLDK
ncbi:hypothetical protein KCU65_g9882, partial [Aureobasidium melanogenum]